MTAMVLGTGAPRRGCGGGHVGGADDPHPVDGNDRSRWSSPPRRQRDTDLYIAQVFHDRAGGGGEKELTASVG